MLTHAYTAPSAVFTFVGLQLTSVADLQYSTDLTAPETAFKPLSIRV